jgi:hypothetical protein
LDLVKILLIGCMVGTAGVHAQEEEAIRWEAGLRLAWSDFQGQPPASKRIAATTASGLSYSYTARGGPESYELDFTVDTFFYPEKSWYHPELCDARVLSHEQLHFDISELFARRLRTRLRETPFSDRVKAEVRKIFEEVNRELSDFQDRYDRETDFSRNAEAQQAWNQAISKLLSETPGR